MKWNDNLAVKIKSGFRWRFVFSDPPVKPTHLSLVYQPMHFINFKFNRVLTGEKLNDPHTRWSVTYKWGWASQASALSAVIWIHALLNHCFVHSWPFLLSHWDQQRKQILGPLNKLNSNLLPVSDCKQFLQMPLFYYESIITLSY